MAFVQAACNSTPISNTLVQAYTSNVTSGNLLVVFACSGIETPSISDTRGTSWTAGPSVDDSGDGERLQCWYGLASSSGANTVTVTYSTSQGDGWIAVEELSGRSGTLTTSATVNMHPTASEPPFVFTCPNGSTVSIAAHDDLSMASVVTEAYIANNWTAGTGFTERCESGVTGLKLDGMLETQDDVSANASYAATALSQNQFTSLGILLSFAQSSGGGGAVGRLVGGSLIGGLLIRF
jgi:hypothetical protein